MRSAGFNTAPISACCAHHSFDSGVDAGGIRPGSTGWVRVTTACISVAALRAMVNGRKEVELFGHHPTRYSLQGNQRYFCLVLFVSGGLILLAANEMFGCWRLKWFRLRTEEHGCQLSFVRLGQNIAVVSIFRAVGP